MMFSKIVNNICENLKELFFEKVTMRFYTFIDSVKDLTKSKKDKQEFNKKVCEIIDKGEQRLALYKEKMKAIKALSEEQKGIQENLNVHKSGSLDSNYRKTLIKYLENIDQEKIGLLQEVLDLGFDPIIKIFKGGQHIEGPLSDIIKIVKSEPPVKAKFIIIKGGKDN